MAQGNYDDSGLSPEIERLSDQLIKNPNSKLFIPLAEEYMKADMAEEAIMTLEEGLKVHPGYMSARVLLGKAHLQKGDMDKACEQFEAVIKAVPDNLYAHKKLGEIYLALNRVDEALKAYKILYLLSPKDEEITEIVSKLESGQIPESPLSDGGPAKAKEKAGETAAAAPAMPAAESAPGETQAPEKPSGEPAAVKAGPDEQVLEAEQPEPVASESVSGEAAPAGTATAEQQAPEATSAEPVPLDVADFDIGEPEQEELEGAAPVYEIDEEIPGMEPDELGADIPAPEDDVFETIESAPVPGQESPFDIGENVPYDSGAEEPLDLESKSPADETPGIGGQGVYDLDAAMDMSAVPDETLFDEPESAKGASPNDEIQEIFSAYDGGQPDKPSEEPEEPGGSVYELDEPSGLDLEELGVKTSIPASQSEDTGQTDIPDMPFEFEDETEMTIPAGAGETPVEELPFDLGGEDAEQDSPFWEAGAGETPVEELPFDLGGEDAEQASPFGDAGVGEAQVEELPFELGVDEELGSPFEDAEALAEEDYETSAEMPVDEPDAAKDNQEPIKTETLAEMYIKQGFYDRAINIYKDMLKDNPGELSIKQKLEELYMLASLGSEKKASEKAEAAGAPAVVEPADFVLEAKAEATLEVETLSEPQPVLAEELAGETVGPEVRGKLEQFLENIRRKAGR